MEEAAANQADGVAIWTLPKPENAYEAERAALIAGIAKVVRVAARARPFCLCCWCTRGAHLFPDALRGLLLQCCAHRYESLSL
jgi:hypothetical protein